MPHYGARFIAARQDCPRLPGRGEVETREIDPARYADAVDVRGLLVRPNGAANLEPAEIAVEAGTPDNGADPTHLKIE